MKLTTQVWCALFAVAFLVPAGYRAATWQRFRPQPIDAAEAKAGEVLFLHDWQPKDPLCPSGDGLGPVFNAKSCVACHGAPSNGGSGDLTFNVTMYTARETGPDGQARVREGVIHNYAVGAGNQETLASAHPELPKSRTTELTLDQITIKPGTNGSRSILRMPRGVRLSQRNTPALYGANLIDAIPDREIIALERRQRVRWGLASSDNADELPVGRAMRLPDGRIGKFGWKAQSASLGAFVRAACANEVGLGNPTNAQPAPLDRSTYTAPGLDLTDDQCNQLTTFIASLPRPIERAPESVSADSVAAGKHLFGTVGCADCHTPDVGPVKGVYSDLLLHTMGAELEGGGFYYNDPLPLLTASATGGGPAPAEWRTPPLWGVADSAPYLHDGRAATLDEAIRMHGGQGARSVKRYTALTQPQRDQLVAFLKSLRAP